MSYNVACIAKAEEQAEVATEPMCGVSGFKTVAHAGGIKEKEEGRSLGRDGIHRGNMKCFVLGSSLCDAPAKESLM